MENIKTLEDACAALGTTVQEQFPEEAKKHLTDDELAYRELKIIAKALNQSDGKAWEPDWSNWNQKKYYPWLEVDTSDGNKAGSGFSVTAAATVTRVRVSARAFALKQAN